MSMEKLAAESLVTRYLTPQPPLIIPTQILTYRRNPLRDSLRSTQLERKETSMKHKYQKEFEHAREEAKKTYTAANDAIAAQQKTLEHELSNVRRERETLRKFKQDLAEKVSMDKNEVRRRARRLIRQGDTGCFCPPLSCLRVVRGCSRMQGLRF